jgi:predicted DNA-binding transcriptional regulator
MALVVGGCHKVDRDRVLGAIIVPACIVGIVTYFWLVFFVAPPLVLQVTAFAAVAAVLVILAWIGYVLATTPRSKSVEEIERELEDELRGVDAREHSEPRQE